MAIQTLYINVAADAVEFALPLLDQMRWRDNQYHLIVPDLTAQLLDHACRHRNRRRTTHERLPGAHAAHQQDAVP